MAQGARDALDHIDDIARYESGEMNAAEIVQLFQDLLDTGLVWRLPGHYVRTAAALIVGGMVVVGRQLPTIRNRSSRRFS